MAGGTLGERELDVMAVLWEAGSGTVEEVRRRLPTKLAYTTVLTILRNLEAKGFVSHDEEGRAHRYAPRVAQRSARRNAVARLVRRFFGGSTEAVLAHLVDEHDLDPDDLIRLARIASKKPKKEGGR
ncbi:MAG: BlaI/MecI/CopY family transcriptional regulator [Gemmatimonadota bacterium]|nr:BlaI/MecI/CopY family transcriptional regulator [Gemmatimonadota bacterium]